jgi:hypothetical protein
MKSRIMRLAGNVARMGEERNAYRILVGPTKIKRQLTRSERRWEENNEMKLQVI